MSYTYEGRTTHNADTYHRWRLEGETRRLQETTSRLQSECKRIGGELAQERDRNAKEIREIARQQTALEERQRQQESLTARMQKRQEEYERKAEQRLRHVEQDLKREIHDSEVRTGERIESVRRETAEKIADVRKDVSHLRADMEQGLSDVRNEVKAVAKTLGARIDRVHQELNEERDRRIATADRRSTGAAHLANWVEERVRGIRNVESLGLTVERTHTEQELDRVREMLGGQDPDAALPVAQTALSNYQTLYVESERRLGVIEGVAEHVERLLARIDEVSRSETFRSLFPAEAGQLDLAVAELRERVQAWRKNRHWTSFEMERYLIADRANQLLGIALELDASSGPLIEQLQAREQRMEQVAKLVDTVAGPMESFEPTYANPADPKSPRLLRARAGNAHVDVYLDLDGTYNIDAYGFPSTVSCQAMADKMGRALQEDSQIDAGRVDATNRQQPSVVVNPTPESWQARVTELTHMTATLPPQAGPR